MTSHSAYDVDLEDINPTLDLVTFQPVRDVTLDTRLVKATYDLGTDFRPRINDWVGLFCAGWRSVDQFLSYRWAPLLPRFLKSAQRRRRTVKFRASDIYNVQDVDSLFQFLYVTSEGHVVGVSASFRIRTLPGYDEDLCFSALEDSFPGTMSFTLIGDELNRKRSLEDRFEFVCDDSVMAPKKKRSGKERIVIVSRDHDSLVNIPSGELPITKSERLQVVNLYPPAKQYVQNRERSVVPYVPNMKPIYDVTSAGRTDDILQNKDTAEPMSKINFLCLPFEPRLPIMPGPESLILSMKDNSKNCRTCSAGKNLLLDYVRRDEKSKQIIFKMESEIKELKDTIKEFELRRDLHTSSEAFRVSQSNLAQLEDILVHNLNLENKLSRLEDNINILLQNQQRVHEDEEQDRSEEIQTCRLLREGFRGVLDIRGRKVEMSDVEYTANDNSEWKVRYPRKIERMRKVIHRQSTTISMLTTKVATQREVIDGKVKDIRGMRDCLNVKDAQNNKLMSRVTEMADRIRAILRDRAKDMTNEWRLFARQIQSDDKATQSSFPFGKKSSKKCKEPRTYDIRSEPTLFNRKKKRTLERVCPICALEFSPHVDPRVIEEHIAFHNHYNSKQAREKNE